MNHIYIYIFIYLLIYLLISFPDINHRFTQYSILTIYSYNQLRGLDQSPSWWLPKSCNWRLRSPPKNDAFPMKNGGFPMKNHGFHMKNCAFPIKKWWFSHEKSWFFHSYVKLPEGMLVDFNHVLLEKIEGPVWHTI